MSLPIVVTHQSSLLHKGLHQLLAKSHFRPVRIATTLTADLETYLTSLERAVWLTGIERSSATTNALLRKVVAANPCIKAVIIAGSQEPEDIVAALKAGACGYVREDIGGETLLKSLEFIANGGMIVHPQLVFSETSATNGRAADIPTIRRPVPTLPSQPRLASGGAKLEEPDNTSDVPSLTRREMLILRALMQGASNKTIALQLVITESTVKVHMKSILRKLRLQNRTQAAVWARNHIDETTLAAGATSDE
jgi:two-component system nitrate/nitrite response regulator NarL